MTEALFREDPYLATCTARVIRITDAGGIVLDRTVFYARSGGQPGDTGTLEDAEGTPLPVTDTVYGEDGSEIVHIPARGANVPAIGAQLTCRLDWPRRHRLMRMHTALHLLSAILDHPVTGGQIGETEGRLDFDIPDAGLDKQAITAALNELVAGDLPVTSRWITDAELDADPGLVRTMSVKPPRGRGRVRLVEIAGHDLQPCGGTHVRRTGEIGPLTLVKIEKKGRRNRRVRIRFGKPDAPA